MTLLSPFDPWSGSLCTCPEKLSLNPYTGCPHGCLYCYASSYIPDFSNCRPKSGLLLKLNRELFRLSGNELVAISNSSDPYPPMERDMELTRGCLNLLNKKGLCVQVVTKSDMVTRDLDILRQMRAAVAITVTTRCTAVARRLEPGAPSPARRIGAIRRLCRAGVPVLARIDPVIPGINDSGIDDLVGALADAGASHVTSSTYKARPDSWRRLCAEFPDEMEATRDLYRRERFGGYGYLPEAIRESVMSSVRAACLAHALTFSTCREGIVIPDTISSSLRGQPGPVCCDGSHLIRARRLK